jgi:hypothetical protein
MGDQSIKFSNSEEVPRLYTYSEMDLEISLQPSSVLKGKENSKCEVKF